MKKIIITLAILILAGCYVPQPLVKVAPTESKYAIVTILNETALKLSHPCSRPVTTCGIANYDFKKYVEKKVAGTGYLYIAWAWRKSLTGEECIVRAYVMYKRKKK